MAEIVVWGSAHKWIVLRKDEGMTNARATRALMALKRDVLADGQVDWEETDRLEMFLRPLAGYLGTEVIRFLDLLDRCRQDEKITPEESELLSAHLELLCARLVIRQLKFWLVVTGVALVIVALFAGGLSHV